MILSKNSWHYRLVTDQGVLSLWSNKVSLCSYFWMVVWSLVKVVSGFLYLLILSLAAGGMFGFVLSYPLTQVWIGNNNVLGVFSLISWACLLHFIWTGLYDADGFTKSKQLATSWDKVLWEKKEVKKVWKQPKPNLLVEYLKAKKSKVCPIMEIK